ncbi:MAG: outer membrane beta-barrel protein [Alphaproteobacteria bacterium]
MGNLKSFALAGLTALAFGSAAQAADVSAPILAAPPIVGAAPAAEAGGWYLRGDIGVSVNRASKFTALQDPAGGTNYVVPNRLANTTYAVRDSKLSESASVGLGAGYAFNNWFRVDVTGELRGAARFTGQDWYAFPGQGGTNVYNGSLRSVVGLVNGYVDLGTFCAFGCLTPFLGAGVGVANHTMSVSDTGVNLFANGTTGAPLGGYGSSTRSSFAFALMAGLGYQVSRNATLEIGYRYLNMGQGPVVRFRDPSTGQFYSNPATGGSTAVRFGTLDAHEIRVGMRWNLNSDCCGRPAEPAPIVARN